MKSIQIGDHVIIRSWDGKVLAFDDRRNLMILPDISRLSVPHLWLSSVFRIFCENICNNNDLGDRTLLFGSVLELQTVRFDRLSFNLETNVPFLSGKSQNSSILQQWSLIPLFDLFDIGSPVSSCSRFLMQTVSQINRFLAISGNDLVINNSFSDDSWWYLEVFFRDSTSYSAMYGDIFKISISNYFLSSHCSFERADAKNIVDCVYKINCIEIEDDIGLDCWQFVPTSIGISCEIVCDCDVLLLNVVSGMFLSLSETQGIYLDTSLSDASYFRLRKLSNTQSNGVINCNLLVFHHIYESIVTVRNGCITGCDITHFPTSVCTTSICNILPINKSVFSGVKMEELQQSRFADETNNILVEFLPDRIYFLLPFITTVLLRHILGASCISETLWHCCDEMLLFLSKKRSKLCFEALTFPSVLVNLMKAYINGISNISLCEVLDHIHDHYPMISEMSFSDFLACLAFDASNERSSYPLKVIEYLLKIKKRSIDLELWQFFGFIDCFQSPCSSNSIIRAIFQDNMWNIFFDNEISLSWENIVAANISPASSLWVLNAMRVLVSFCQSCDVRIQYFSSILLPIECLFSCSMENFSLEFACVVCDFVYWVYGRNIFMWCPLFLDDHISVFIPISDYFCGNKNALFYSIGRVFCYLCSTDLSFCFLFASLQKLTLYVRDIISENSIVDDMLLTILPCYCRISEVLLFECGNRLLPRSLWLSLHSCLYGTFSFSFHVKFLEDIIYKVNCIRISLNESSLLQFSCEMIDHFQRLLFILFHLVDDENHWSVEEKLNLDNVLKLSLSLLPWNSFHFFEKIGYLLERIDSYVAVKLDFQSIIRGICKIINILLQFSQSSINLGFLEIALKDLHRILIHTKSSKHSICGVSVPLLRKWQFDIGSKMQYGSELSDVLVISTVLEIIKNLQVFSSTIEQIFLLSLQSSSSTKYFVDNIDSFCALMVMRNEKIFRRIFAFQEQNCKFIELVEDCLFYVQNYIREEGIISFIPLLYEISFCLQNRFGISNMLSVFTPFIQSFYDERYMELNCWDHSSLNLNVALIMCSIICNVSLSIDFSPVDMFMHLCKVSGNDYNSLLISLLVCRKKSFCILNFISSIQWSHFLELSDESWYLVLHYFDWSLFSLLGNLVLPSSFSFPFVSENLVDIKKMGTYIDNILPTLSFDFSSDDFQSIVHVHYILFTKVSSSSTSLTTYEVFAFKFFKMSLFLLSIKQFRSYLKKKLLVLKKIGQYLIFVDKNEKQLSISARNSEKLQFFQTISIILRDCGDEVVLLRFIEWVSSLSSPAISWRNLLLSGVLLSLFDGLIEADNLKDVKLDAIRACYCGFVTNVMLKRLRYLEYELIDISSMKILCVFLRKYPCECISIMSLRIESLCDQDVISLFRGYSLSLSLCWRRLSVDTTSKIDERKIMNESNHLFCIVQRIYIFREGIESRIYVAESIRDILLSFVHLGDSIIQYCQASSWCCSNNNVVLCSNLFRCLITILHRKCVFFSESWVKPLIHILKSFWIYIHDYNCENNVDFVRRHFSLSIDLFLVILQQCNNKQEVEKLFLVLDVQKILSGIINSSRSTLHCPRISFSVSTIVSEFADMKFCVTREKLKVLSITSACNYYFVEIISFDSTLVRVYFRKSRLVEQWWSAEDAVSLREKIIEKLFDYKDHSNLNNVLQKDFQVLLSLFLTLDVGRKFPGFFLLYKNMSFFKYSHAFYLLTLLLNLVLAFNYPRIYFNPFSGYFSSSFPYTNWRWNILLLICQLLHLLVSVLLLIRCLWVTIIMGSLFTLDGFSIVAWRVFGASSSLCGLLFSLWFYVPLVLECFFIFQSMYYLLEAIRSNFSRLLGALAIFGVFLYLSSMIALALFPSQFSLNDHTGCIDPLSCFALFLGYGLNNAPNWLNSGPIVASIKRFHDNYLDSYLSSTIATAYTVLYVILVNLVLQAVISGIIIDAFSSLRENFDSRIEYMNNSCLVCQLQRDDFEKRSFSFEDHVKQNHYLWKYFWYYASLCEKDESSLHGYDQYVFNRIKNGRFCDIIPHRRSLTLERSAESN